MSAGKKIHILASGLDGASAEKWARMPPEELEKILNEDLDRIRANPKIDLTVCWMSLQGEKSQIARQLEPYLKDGPWDGVMIGFGVRGIPKLSWLFEEVIALLRQHAPTAKYLFSEGMSDHLETIYRNFPDTKPHAA